MKIKDVVDTSSQNINPLPTEDLTKILDQATHHAQLCENPILVSVEELQKSVEKIKKERWNHKNHLKSVTILDFHLFHIHLH